jgi:hypothetical protein
MSPGCALAYKGIENIVCFTPPRSVDVGPVLSSAQDHWVNQVRSCCPLSVQIT